MSSMVLPVYWLMVTIGKDGDGTFVDGHGELVHGRLSATELARRLEVTPRTVLRDMEALRANLDAQEGSRFAQLQAYIDERFETLGQSVSRPALPSADLAETNARLDALQRDLNLQLAQMDDYLKRRLQ